jgi:hypothetical protein
MPTTIHLIFDAQQRPFEVPTSPDDKTIYSCNYISKTDGVSTKYLEQVAKKLDDAGIATRDTDLFVGLKRTFPTGAGPYIRLLSTSGIAPDIDHGANNVLDMPGLQVLVIGDNPSTTRDKAIEIYNNLIASANVALSDT